ncbi:MAG: hypothetical protein AAGE01_23395 [Pseudomonadota bacterium]
MRDCETCSACCKVTRVRELDKPAGKWCQHCEPGGRGCTIYETRFEVCKTYKCFWLTDTTVLPNDARPDRSKIMFDLQPPGDSGLPGFVRAFELTIGAAQSNSGRKLVQQFLRRGKVVVTFPPNNSPGLMIFPPRQLQHVREQGIREGALFPTRDPDVFRFAPGLISPDS